jgi:hypothetical protein
MWLHFRVLVFFVDENTHSSAPQFEVPGLFHHHLIHVIKAVLQETATKSYHLFPFQEFWQPSPDTPPEHIWSELYTADAFIVEHEMIQLHPQEDGLENVIIGLMLWSDLTYLTSFGNALLWPIYLYIGNLSKYTHGKPTSFSAHHVAYIPKLVNTINNFYLQKFSKSLLDEVLTHCKRVLFQEI